MDEMMVQNNAVTETGLTTVEPPATVTAHKMNVPVVIGAAAAGTAFGLFLSWVIPKAFGAMKNKNAAKAQVDDEVDQLKKQLNDDLDEFVE